MGVLSNSVGYGLMSASALGLLGGAASCSLTTDNPECPGLCQLLADCGVLPSALGNSTGKFSDQANCEQRCALTEASIRDDINQCSKDVDRTWCQERNSCRSFAACLEARFPDQQATGVAQVTVAAVPWEHAAYDPCSSTPTGNTGGAGGEGGAGAADARNSNSFDETTARDWCTRVRASRGRVVFSDAVGMRFGDDTDCVSLLTKPASFVSVRPGLVEYGIELRGTLTLPGLTRPEPSTAPGGLQGAGGTSLVKATATAADEFGSRQLMTARAPDQQPSVCVYLPGARAQISPGSTELVVPVRNTPRFTRSVGECNGRPTSCGDGQDNDGDGLVDCADPKCACTTSSTTSTPEAGQ